MKKIASLLFLFLLFVPSVASAQTPGSAKTAADRSWPKFWAEFRAAFNRRDVAALKGTMSSPFNKNCTIEGEGGPPDRPEPWLNRLSQKDWRNLQKLFALGMKSRRNKGRSQRVTTGDPETFSSLSSGRTGDGAGWAALAMSVDGFI